MKKYRPKQYKLKLTALTPVHIGTGEVYEPTNFVIDDGYLYEFDEVLFYKHLDNNQKKMFLSIVEQKNEESLFQIHKLIKNNKQIAKKIATSKIKVANGIQKDYDKKIGNIVQREGKINTKNVFNKFHIDKTTRLVNKNNIIYIPGSSIKGSISTAYQEKLFKRNKKLYEDLFRNESVANKIFKNLSISDTVLKKGSSIIGYGLNKERFEDNKLGPNTKVEVIFSNQKQQSIFETTLTFKDYEKDLDYKIDFKELRQACNEHYLPIFQQMFKPEAMFNNEIVEEYTNEYFSDEFYEQYKNFMPNSNQFLIRVGKYSQARAVTIDGIRRIKVKISGGGPKKKKNHWESYEQETTTWFFGFNERSINNLLPFGWILCEVIDEY